MLRDKVNSDDHASAPGRHHCRSGMQQKNAPIHRQDSCSLLLHSGWAGGFLVLIRQQNSCALVFWTCCKEHYLTETSSLEQYGTQHMQRALADLRLQVQLLVPD